MHAHLLGDKKAENPTLIRWDCEIDFSIFRPKGVGYKLSIPITGGRISESQQEICHLLVSPWPMILKRRLQAFSPNIARSRSPAHILPMRCVVARIVVVVHNKRLPGERGGVSVRCFIPSSILFWRVISVVLYKNNTLFHILFVSRL